MTRRAKLHLWRWIAAALIVGLPLLFNYIANSENADLHALMTRGVRTQGVTTGISSTDGKQFVHYRYSDGSQTFNWNVEADRAPGTVGLPLDVVYLPDRPKVHWVGPPLTEAVIAGETQFSRRAVWVLLGVFGLIFFANEYQLRRDQAGAPPFILGTRAAGILAAVVFYLVLVLVQFDPNVRAVDEKAFGPAPLGLPTVPFVWLLTTVLFLPAIPVLLHASILLRQATAEGSHVGHGLFLLYLLRVGRTHPDLRHSQAIVTFGLCYFFLVAVAWIAYTAHLGI